MAINPQSIGGGSHMGGLARRLVADKLLTEDSAKDLHQKALKANTPFVSLLVEQKLVKAADIARRGSQEFGAPLADLSVLQIDQELVNEIGEKLVRRHRALPLFKRGKRLFLAVADPTNLAALDEIKFATGLQTEAVVV